MGGVGGSGARTASAGVSTAPSSAVGARRQLVGRRFVALGLVALIGSLGLVVDLVTLGLVVALGLVVDLVALGLVALGLVALGLVVVLSLVVLVVDVLFLVFFDLFFFVDYLADRAPQEAHFRAVGDLEDDEVVAHLAHRPEHAAHREDLVALLDHALQLFLRPLRAALLTVGRVQHERDDYEDQQIDDHGSVLLSSSGIVRRARTSLTNSSNASACMATRARSHNRTRTRRLCSDTNCMPAISFWFTRWRR